MKIDGRCHCGYVTFEAEADPETTTICNCKMRCSGDWARLTCALSDHALGCKRAAPNRSLAIV